MSKDRVGPSGAKWPGNGMAILHELLPPDPRLPIQQWGDDTHGLHRRH